MQIAVMAKTQSLGYFTFKYPFAVYFGHHITWYAVW